MTTRGRCAARSGRGSDDEAFKPGKACGRFIKEGARAKGDLEM